MYTSILCYIGAGADLGILERWSCDSSACKAHTQKNLKPHPLNETTPSLPQAALSTLGTGTQTIKKKKTSGFTTAGLECGFITCSELTSTTAIILL